MPRAFVAILLCIAHSANAAPTALSCVTDYPPAFAGRAITVAFDEQTLQAGIGRDIVPAAISDLHVAFALAGNRWTIDRASGRFSVDSPTLTAFMRGQCEVARQRF